MASLKFANGSTNDPNGKEIYDFFFKSLDGEVDRHKCVCGTTLKFAKGKGYTPSVNHIKNVHSDWLSVMQEKLRRPHGIIDGYLTLVKDRAKDIYGWIDWIITSNLVFSFVEDPKSRQYSKLGKISRNTLTKYMDKIIERIVVKLTAELAGKLLGLLFDGWSEDGLHMVAIFVVYEGPDGEAILRLLAVAPMLDETSFDADTHINFMESTLALYGLSLAMITFICGDNCRTNQSIATKAGKLFFGCNSHRFNIGVRTILEEPRTAETLSAIENLMIKLRTLKCAGRLRQLTPLAAKKRNVTRWLSAGNMVKRYEELRQFPIQTCLDDDDLDLILTTAMNRRVTLLLPIIENLQCITKVLQNANGVSLLTVRTLFNFAVVNYPDLASSLDADASIVHDPVLEAAVVLVLEGKESELTVVQSRKLEPFLKLVDPPVAGEPEIELSFAERAIQAYKTQRVAPSESKYVNLAWIPPTTNHVERFFSRLKLVFSDRRKSLTPKHLEAVLYLLVNRNLWDVRDVNDIFNPGEVVDDFLEDVLVDEDEAEF